jgi:hypothetical protein
MSLSLDREPPGRQVMPMDYVKELDPIAVLALVAAIASGLLNYLYTRRMSLASSYPVL